MNTLLRMAVLAMLVLGLVTTASAATIYKWTAEDGSVTYGQLPPRGVDAVPVDSSGAAPSVVPAASAGEGTETAATEETAEPEPDVVRVDDEEGMAAACESARQNISVLENPAVRRVREGNGETRVLNQEERETRLHETREFIEEWC